MNRRLINHPELNLSLYPSSVSFNNVLQHGRGSFAETVIRHTIEVYHQHHIALIHQSLPEWTKQQRSLRGGNHVQCDYVGLFRGHYVELEVKETRQRSFPVHNIKLHQWQRLAAVNQHGGLALLVLYLGYQQQFFLLSFAVLQRHPARRFLTTAFLQQYGHELTLSHNLTLNLNVKMALTIRTQQPCPPTAIA